MKLTSQKERGLIYLCLVGLISVLIPFFTVAPANAGLFHCRNLKKRTEINQKSYEKSLFRYQNSLAKWVNAGGQRGGTRIVQSRFNETGNRILVILRDFWQFDKCTRYDRDRLNALITSVNKTIKEAHYFSFRYVYPLGELYDFRNDLN